MSCALALSVSASSSTGDLGKKAAKPHILFLLADDMGYANIGYHRKGAASADEIQGQREVQTPTIDELAGEGVILERHYAYRICGPSRSALLSGRLGTHVLALNVAVTASNEKDPISGYAGIPRNMTGMGEKMLAGGYRTHYVGKWDAGMATPQHTPRGRGFETSFLYYQHANDYWNKKTGIQATGEITQCLNSFWDLMIENDTYRGPYKGPALTDECKDSEERTPYCYEEKMFEERSLDIIWSHNASDTEHPLFLFHAFHLLHTPLQVPNFYYRKVNSSVAAQGGSQFDSHNRWMLMAMTNYMDDTIRNLTNALKAKGMWEDTLVVFTTDNGGPIYEPGSANNYPLRGGKYSDFEGGVRTNTFISGGFIPKSSRGSVYDSVVSIADWYYMFSELAGVNPTDTKAEEANQWLRQQGLTLLPPVDGKPGMLDHILSGTVGRNGSLFLSSTALLDYPYKLVVGKQPYMAHTGPLYPNCTTIAGYVGQQGPDFVDFGVLEYKPDLGDRRYWRGDCGRGCLYNLEQDPGEQVDLSGEPQMASKLESMISELAEYNKTLFVPDRGETKLSACLSVMLNGGGHFGPFAHIDGYYTDKPREFNDLSDHEIIQVMEMTTTDLSKVKEIAHSDVVAKGVLSYLEVVGDACCQSDPRHVCKNGPLRHNATWSTATADAAKALFV